MAIFLYMRLLDTSSGRTGARQNQLLIFKSAKADMGYKLNKNVYSAIDLIARRSAQVGIGMQIGWKELLERMTGENLYQIILSNPRDRKKVEKVKVRPVLLRDGLFFQETAYIGNQVFHANHDKKSLVNRLQRYMEEDFRQCEIEAADGRATALVSKKGKVTVNYREKPAADKKAGLFNADGLTGTPLVCGLAHNREKRRILVEGRPVPFLVDLGVQTPDGGIVKAKYDKFRQINRFLEFIEDILPTLPKERTIRIIDFGCGKSYLTFAIYYFLKELKGLDVSITGLDLKKDVIQKCSALAARYGYEGLEFLQGDIGSYEGGGPGGENEADMVVTLHACDTATDYALAKAVKWKARVILSVPCCQHEVNGQIACDALAPVLKYGLLKERMSALLTDGIRAGLLEEQGYEVQLLEFIDMEHTPKNILIRAVKKPEAVEPSGAGMRELTDFLHVETTLQKLLQEK